LAAAAMMPEGYFPRQIEHVGFWRVFAYLFFAKLRQLTPRQDHFWEKPGIAGTPGEPGSPRDQQSLERLAGRGQNSVTVG